MSEIVWFPVEKTSPEEGSIVLVAGGQTWNGTPWNRATFENGVFWDEHDIEMTNLTHWAIVPYPPQVGR